MKAKQSKLRLAKETVRRLSDAQLERAHGGLIAASATCGAQTCQCSFLQCSEGCAHAIPVTDYSCKCAAKTLGG